MVSHDESFNNPATYPAPPTLRVSCTQPDPWRSLWGPEISCTSDPSNLQFLNIGTTSALVPSSQVAPLLNTFKCNIFTKHLYDYDADYTCDPTSNLVEFTSNCVYNTSIWLSNVLSPVAELDLILPSSRHVVGSSDFPCERMRQVLHCPDIKLNASFYENSFETSWMLEPIKCYLSYSMFGRDDRGAHDSMTENPIFVNDEYTNLALGLAVNEVTGMATNGVETGATTYEWWFLCVLIFIVAGAVGNLLVCFAVTLDRKLQNVTNYFLFSLAIADLLVSLVVMPLGVIPSFMGYWPLGLAWCHVYATCDVLACSSSILHMCFISVGRYVGIRNPLRTIHSSTKRTTFIKITIVWLMAMVVCSSITVLGLINKENIMPHPKMCTINNRAFFVFGSLVTFYIPMVMMVSTFALTVRLLRQKAKFAKLHPDENWRRVPTIKSTIAMSSPPSTPTRGMTNGSSNGNATMVSSSARRLTHSTSQSAINRSTQTTCISSPEASVDTTTEAKRYKLKSLNFQFSNMTRPSINLNIRFLNGRSKRQNLSANAVATEQKATKVLGVVFFAFVLCWSPFFILNIVFAICPDCDISPIVVELCLWLGYVSSTINPIIYTIFNKTFRAAFIRLLRCDCSTHSALLRYRSVNERSGGTTTSVCSTPSALPVAISMQGSPLLAPSIIHSSTLEDFRGSYTITDDEC